jgi:hypothetical protein
LLPFHLRQHNLFPNACSDGELTAKF